MSTILKALRRLEEERTAKAERALREQVVSPAPRAAGGGRRLLLRGLGVLAAVALAGLGLHSWLARPTARPAAPPPAQVAPQAVTALPRPAAPPAAPPAANPLAPSPRPPLGAPPGAASPLAAAPPGAGAAGAPPGAPPGAIPPNQVSGGETGPLRSTPAEVRAAAAALAPRPDVAVVQRPPPSPGAALEGGPEASAAPKEAPQGAQPAPGTVPPFPRMAPAPEPSPAGEDASTSSVPIRLREIDPSIHSPYGLHEEAPRKPLSHAKAAQPHTGAAAGEVMVTRTVWHPSAERRLAVVRSAGDSQEREVHEGDSVGSLQVLRIEPSDVVFLRDGVEIRQRVGPAQ